MQSMEDQFHFKMAGLAGEGITVSGLVFTKFANRAGYYSFDYLENPSLIRGGHNVFYATISARKVYSAHRQVNLLVALNEEAVELHQGNVNPGGGILYDPEEFSVSSLRGRRLFPVPLSRLADQAGGKIMANTVALGAVVWLTGGRLEVLQTVLSDVFGAKSQEIGEQNARAAQLGYEAAKEAHKPLNTFFVQYKKTRRMVVAGNEAIGAGAIAAGMQLAAIYPMTPISSLLAYLAEREKAAKIVVRQPEDEIAGINMALGAAYAGVRSLVATSGGGFALMTETLSLAGLTETPVVVVFGQRAGPATGIPTWTAQEDLLFALSAAQGEYARILLAPGDAEECFAMTVEAFHLAEKYQTPVVLLVDKLVCEGHQSVADFDWSKVEIDRGKLVLPFQARRLSRPYFPRYRVTKDGVSPRTYPAPGVVVKANSDEHDELGFSDERIDNRNAQVEKRMRKLNGLAEDWPGPVVYGPKQAAVTLVGWGSVKGPVLQALDNVRDSRLKDKVNFLHFTHLQPLPVAKATQAMKKARKLVLIENNYQGQLGSWLRQQTGIAIPARFLKYSGRQFYPEEIVREVGKYV